MSLKRRNRLATVSEFAKIRDAVVQADNALLPEAQRIYTNSAVVSSRLTRFNGIASEVLHPPLWDASGYRCDDAEGYIFCGGRISPGKRQHLLVEAMRHVRTNTRLIVAGSPDLPEHLDQLETLVRKHDLADRVTILGRWISEEEKHDLFARSLACAYIPYDEDSYGYVTLESFHSRKPVITCDDSGGVLELVEDDATGRVVPPDPTALAEAIDELAGDRPRTRRLGEAGHDRLVAAEITWDKVVGSLLA